MGRRNGTPTVASQLIDLPISSAEHAGTFFDVIGLNKAKSIRCAVYNHAKATGRQYTIWLLGPHANDSYSVLVKRLK